MPRATTKPKPRKPKTPRAVAVPDADVFTLAEAAAYLRLPEAEVQRLTREDGLPGQRVGSDWRFLKASIQDWLRRPAPWWRGIENASALPREDDDSAFAFLRDIYRQRGHTDAEIEERYGAFFPNRARPAGTKG